MTSIEGLGHSSMNNVGYRRAFSDSSNEIEDLNRFLEKVVATPFEASPLQMGQYAHRQNRERQVLRSLRIKATTSTLSISDKLASINTMSGKVLDYLDSARACRPNLGLKAGKRKLLLQRCCFSRLIIDDENGLFTCCPHVRYYYPAR